MAWQGHRGDPKNKKLIAKFISKHQNRRWPDRTLIYEKVPHFWAYSLAWWMGYIGPMMINFSKLRDLYSVHKLWKFQAIPSTRSRELGLTIWYFYRIYIDRYIYIDTTFFTNFTISKYQLLEGVETWYWYRWNGQNLYCALGYITLTRQISD